MPQLIVVLADDFSGAAEIAGAALEHGLLATVWADNYAEFNVQDSQPVIVQIIDTNTRSLSHELATKRILEICDQLRRDCKPEWLYKKIDSILRGPVIAEIDACCKSLSYTSCLLVNANPRKGRTVKAGEIWVGDQTLDQTAFAQDPEYPRTTSSVLSLLGTNRSRCQMIDPGQDTAQDWVPQVWEVWVPCIARKGSEVPVYVGNVQSTSELIRLAGLQHAECLRAGGAEFFEALLQVHGFGRSSSHFARLNPHGRILVVSGTAMRDKSADELGTSEQWVYMDDIDFEQTVAKICERLELNLPVKLSTSKQVVELAFSESLHERLVAMVCSVMARCSLQQLWIEGGRTASSLVRAIGWKQLQGQTSFADGVVGLRAVEPNAPLVVVKPGSYPWPNGVTECSECETD